MAKPVTKEFYRHYTIGYLSKFSERYRDSGDELDEGVFEGFLGGGSKNKRIQI